MPLCLWGGSPLDVAQPQRTAGQPWTTMPAASGRAPASLDRAAQHVEEQLAEARAGAQTLREQLRSADDKAALLLSYRDAADQEHRRIRQESEALQVSVADIPLA